MSSTSIKIDEPQQPRQQQQFTSATMPTQADDEGGFGGCMAGLITFISILLVIVTFPISIFMVVKQVQVS